MQLQQNLYEQLTDNNSMPKGATKGAASQKRELIKSAKGKLALLVLDGRSDACNDDTRNVSSHICVRAQTCGAVSTLSLSTASMLQMILSCW